MMTLWRFLAAKKVALEARAGDAADRARPPSGNARPRPIVSVDFDRSDPSAVDRVASETEMLPVNSATYCSTSHCLWCQSTVLTSNDRRRYKPFSSARSPALPGKRVSQVSLFHLLQLRFQSV